jgi:hypothetical protein
VRGGTESEVTANFAVVLELELDGLDAVDVGELRQVRLEVSGDVHRHGGQKRPRAKNGAKNQREISWSQLHGMRSAASTAGVAAAVLAACLAGVAEASASSSQGASGPAPSGSSAPGALLPALCAPGNNTSLCTVGGTQEGNHRHWCGALWCRFLCNWPFFRSTPSKLGCRFRLERPARIRALIERLLFGASTPCRCRTCCSHPGTCTFSDAAMMVLL